MPVAKCTDVIAGLRASLENEREASAWHVEQLKAKLRATEAALEDERHERRLLEVELLQYRPAPVARAIAKSPDVSGVRLVHDGCEDETKEGVSK